MAKSGCWRKACTRKQGEGKVVIYLSGLPTLHTYSLLLGAPLGFPLNSLVVIPQLYDFIDGSQIHITINSRRPHPEHYYIEGHAFIQYMSP